MVTKVDGLEHGWSQVDALLRPLVDAFQLEMDTHLRNMHANGIEAIGEYREQETRQLMREYSMQRAKLIDDFRVHFSGFDLSEGATFDRFNAEVRLALTLTLTLTLTLPLTLTVASSVTITPILIYPLSYPYSPQPLLLTLPLPLPLTPPHPYPYP